MRGEFASTPESTYEDPIKCLVDAGRNREFERRVELLESGTPRRRIQAAAALIEFGGDAVEPLTHALRDPNDRVKVAASKALARIGDARAVQPLTEALRHSLMGRSGRRHALISIAPLALGLLSITTFLIFNSGGQHRTAAYFVVGCGILRLLLKAGMSLRNSSHLQEEVVEALAAIAERDPVPELRETLPDLRMLSKAALLGIDGRRAVGAAAAKIDRLTADLRTLPIAASERGSRGDQLPRVAASGPVEPKELPFPAGPGRT